MRTIEREWCEKQRKLFLRLCVRHEFADGLRLRAIETIKR